jgi:hypothetical protein
MMQCALDSAAYILRCSTSVLLAVDHRWSASPSKIDACQTLGLEQTQTGIGRSDQKSIFQAHTDVAGSRVNIATVEEALADTANFFARV